MSYPSRRGDFQAVPQHPENGEYERTDLSREHGYGTLASPHDEIYQEMFGPGAFHDHETDGDIGRQRQLPEKWSSTTTADHGYQYDAWTGPELGYGHPEAPAPEFPLGTGVGNHPQSPQPSPSTPRDSSQLGAEYRKRPNYKPSALRWPFLVTLLLCLIALLVLLVYSFHVLPVQNFSVTTVNDNTPQRRTNERLARADSQAVISTATTAMSTKLVTSTPQLGSSTARDAYGDVDKSITSTTTKHATSTTTPEMHETTAQDAYGDVDKSITSTTEALTTKIVTTTTDAYGDVDTSVTVTIPSKTAAMSTGKDAYGDVDTSITKTVTKSATPEVTATTDQDAYGDTGTSITVTSHSVYLSTSHDAYGEAGKSLTVTSHTVALSTDQDAYGNAGTSITKTDNLGKISQSTMRSSTVSYVTAVVTTLTGSDGTPTFTSTSTPSAFSTTATTTLTNSLGSATATVTTGVLATPTVSTLTDASGAPTATVTNYPVIVPSNSNSDTVETTVFFITAGRYFFGFCVPTILAIIISIPIRILDQNAKLFQPWHELTRTHASKGRESLCLPTGGWESYVNTARSLMVGEQVQLFLTGTLSICSSFLVPLAGSAISLRTRGTCTGGSAKGCTWDIIVVSEPAKATVALLAFMALLLILLIGFLFRWQTGVETNPWSICGIAGLSQNKDVRALFASGQQGGARAAEMEQEALEDILKQRRFRLSWFYNESNKLEYGVVLDDHHDEGSPLQAARESVADGTLGSTSNYLPFFMLGYFGRCLLLFILGGLLAVIIYYYNTGYDSGFERFMDSQSYGVNFFFTSVGVIITLFWSSFVTSKSRSHTLQLQ